MSKDRLFQLAALVLAVVALFGSALVVPLVNQQRRDLQLSLESDNVVAASMGSFKGLAVNALWYRAEMEKRAGRYAEANTLAEMITDLQPRFPQVWAFHAWNMAYNISVATFTPRERWDWVDKGIRLLREEGLRYNPDAGRLYRELSWTLFHKVGQFTDDMNWYYKGYVAREWHEVLGGPNDYLAGQDLLDYYVTIAVAGDRYLRFDRPGRGLRAQLDDMAEAIPEVAEIRDDFRRASLNRTRAMLVNVRDTVAGDGRVESAARLADVIAGIDEILVNANRDPVAVFREDFPTAGVAIDALREAGFALDARTLRAIGKLRMYSRLLPPQRVMALPDPYLDNDARAMGALFFARTDPEFQQGLNALLPFLRARVLTDVYNMDPEFMLRLMEEHGPIDWRHPMAHSLYWAARGIEVAETLRNSDIDWVNTYRLVVHSLQSLTDYGRVSFNPLMSEGRQVDLMPDPAFLDSYGNQLERIIEAVENNEEGRFGNLRMQNFESGHENYMHKAIMLSYMYGSEAKAQAYYADLREAYGDAPHNLRDRRYEQPLADLVWQFIREDIDTQNTARYFFETQLRRAFVSGLAYGRLSAFGQILGRAQELHDRYQSERNYETGITEQGRLSLPPFGQMVEDAYVRFMQDPQLDLVARSNAYANAPLPLVQRTYHRWIGVIEQQMPDARQVFPEPEGALPPDVNAEQQGVNVPAAIDRQ
ncbi:MAG: hypothetical protein AAGE65_15170 [Planctomycetota bacterium]